MQSEFKVHVQLGHLPDWTGSIHDDKSAQTYGYRGALVPGPTMHGYLTRPAVELWGVAWLERGVMTSHCRRPAYDGQELWLRGSLSQEDPTRMSVTASDHEGKVIAMGDAVLPGRPAQSLSLEDFSHLAFSDTLPQVKVGELPTGLRFMSRNDVFSEQDHLAYLDLLSDSWPEYRRNGWLHPSYAVRLATHNATRSFKSPTPGIYVSGWAQHFNIAHVGDRIRTSGRVTGSYERKGNHYYDTEEMVIANDTTPIALVRRSVIYVIGTKAAAATAATTA